jgi:DNA topoisomerase-2
MKEFITPIIKATRGNNVETFYTMHDYKIWCASLNNNTKGWKIKYYKGLGTSTDKEAQEYFSLLNRHKIDFMYADNKDDDAIDLAFNKKKTEDRKVWLANYDPNNVLDSTELTLSYENFINKEFILYSISDNQRSIPSVCDGLKPSERKILYACFKRKLKDEIKVAQLSGYVAEHSAYHHGEQSLCSTIAAMAQNFVGSNNINLLMPLGQFGTRNQGGKDSASARYIFTNLNKVTRHLFNDGDDALMDYIIEEGQRIEPNWYLPTIPTILVNGAEGIGTGWSTSIPCYNPREIVDNIKTRMKVGIFNEMKPWYKGYQGSIEKNGKGSYTVTGKFEWVEKDGTTWLVINELPIKRWTKDYKTYINKLMGYEDKKDKDEDKKKRKKKKEEDESEEESKKKIKIIVEDLKEYHTNNRVHFEIKLLDEFFEEYKEDPEKVIKTFKLQTSLNITNMVLFDRNLKIRKYNQIEDILEEFYELRISYYERRKTYLLSNLKRDLEILDNKVRFILAVINEDIIIRKVKRKDLINALIKNNYTPMSKINKIKMKSALEDEIIQADQEEEEEEGAAVPSNEYDYLLSLPLWSLTYEKVEEMLKNKENKNKEIEILSNTSEKSLWENDLSEFLRVLDEVEAKEEDDRLGSNKLKRAKAGGKTKGKKGETKNKKEDKKKDKENKKEDKKEDKAAIPQTQPEKKQSTLNPFLSNTKSQQEATKMTLMERLALKSIIN